MKKTKHNKDWLEILYDMYTFFFSTPLRSFMMATARVIMTGAPANGVL